MFKKQLNQKGNKGRDALYMYMEHWADAFLGKGYAKGGEIKVGQQYDWYKNGVENTIYVTDITNGIVHYRLNGRATTKNVKDFENYIKENNLKVGNKI